jgi:putative spermidine/putrescine transport system permease protein
VEPKPLRVALRIWVALVLAFLFIPIVLIVLYAFNRSNIESWPISGFSLHWFSVAWHDAQVRSAFWLSVKVGLVATGLALVLGSAVAYALSKFAFFGREGISFLLVLPLALPGIISGIALNSFFSFTGIQLGTLTIVVGHTTFCIVVVYNNLIARLRRTPGSLAEASMDLGARGWQTLRYVTLPLTATALVSGALLAFGLSFDEVIVTVFTAGAQNTLPLWIFGAIRLGQQLPEVNAVVSVVILLTIVPVVLAARLAGAGSVTRSARNVPVGELGGLLFPDLPLDAAQHGRHAAQPQRAHQVVQSELAGELRGRGQDLLGAEAVQAGRQDGGEAAGGGRLGGRVEEQADGLVRFDLDGQEQRGLAFRHRLEQAVLLGVAGGQRGQLLGELQQQLEPVLGRDVVEVVDDLGEPGMQRASGHGLSGHGLSPRVIGARTLFPHSVQDPS